MRVVGRAIVSGLAAAACLAAVAPAAQAWVKVAKAAGDPRTTWTLTAHTVTVRSSNPALLGFVRGSDVLLGCGRSRQGPIVLTWGEHASSITFQTLAIPRSQAHCDLIEVGPVPRFFGVFPFSWAPFSPAARTRLASTLPPGPLLARYELYGYWDSMAAILGRFVGVQYLSRFGDVIRLPPASTLVRKANRGLRATGDGMLYAPTLTGVTVPHVVYAIGRGSGRKELEMAVIGFDGKRYVLRASVADNASHFGPG